MKVFACGSNATRPGSPREGRGNVIRSKREFSVRRGAGLGGLLKSRRGDDQGNGASGVVIGEKS